MPASKPVSGSSTKGAARPTVKHTNQTKRTDLERARLLSLVNSMADGVIATDENGMIAITNGAALNILDTNNTIVNKQAGDYLHLIDKNNTRITISDLLKETKTQMTTRDWRFIYPDGTTINLYVSIAPVHLGFGLKGSRGHVILLRDITKEKSLEEERDEFISVVSHELRTPIAIAEGNIGNAEYIFKKSHVHNPAIMDSLQQAHDQVNFLAGMINDLATLSRAERGILTLEQEAINAYELLNDLGKMYQTNAEKKDLQFIIELDPKLELLYSSKLYVREIIQNFVTNALKYTDKGSVTLGAKQAQQGIEFYVRDTGIGISKTDQEKIFDKFFRSEDYRTRQTNGTGLGLYVTLKLARLINAEITVSSELNKGSTFTIFVPNLKMN